MPARPEYYGDWHWRAGPVDGGRAVVFDMDGVLSDAASRQHFLEGPWRDWDAFFEACGDDPLIEEVAQLLGLLDPDLAIVLLTARPAAGAAPDPGLAAPLRPALGPARHAGLRRLRRGPGLQAPVGPGAAAAGFDLALSFEDDRRNVAMFRDEGVPCVYIHSGYYD